VGVIGSIREWINEGVGRWVVIIVALAAVGLAVWAVVHYTVGDPAGDIIDEGQFMLIRCEACNHSERRRQPYGVKFPVACPACKEVKAVWAQKCGTCQEVFARPSAARYACPKCNAAYYTEQAEDF